MEDILGNLNPIYTLIFSFILTTISKISDNSFITLVLMKKKIIINNFIYIFNIFFINFEFIINNIRIYN